jgi:glycosyltransferase involved in cell wall biosynthesis
MLAAHNGLDVASLVSTREGFANAVGEAMACAVQCVVTNLGDCADIVVDTGAVIQSGDPNALGEAWQTMLAYTPDERANWGAPGGAFLEYGSVMSLVDRTFNALISVVSGALSRETNDLSPTYAILGHDGD